MPVNEEDIILGMILGAFVMSFFILGYSSYRDRKHVYATAHTLESAQSMVKRISRASGEMPKVNTVWPSIGTPYWVIRVPKDMLKETRYEDAIEKLKEPLDV